MEFRVRYSGVPNRRMGTAYYFSYEYNLIWDFSSVIKKGGTVSPQIVSAKTILFESLKP